MKITSFNGSPRAKNGNTHVMVEALLAGAKKAGADTENIFLAKKDIKHCMGCFACWSKTPGKCVIKDDMAGLLKQYMASDIVIYASPLYVDFVTGIMKDFMDRRLPIVCPQFEKEEGRETVHKKRFDKYPAIAFVSNCGFPEHGQFEMLKLYCERRLRNNQAKIVAQIYRNQGELLKVDNPALKPAIEGYKDLLKKAGEEIVRHKGLSETTKRELEKPLMPEDEYTRLANESW